MAVVSLVKFSSLEGSKRIDAEYYRPHYLEVMHVLHRAPVPKKHLSGVSTKIDVGFVGPMAHAYTDQTGVPLLQTRNVKEFFVDFHDLIYIQETFHLLLGKSQVSGGDVLIARSGSIGNAALVFENDPMPLNSSDIIIIRPVGVDAGFLVAFLNSLFGRIQIERFASGGIQGHVNIGSLEKLLVPMFGELQEKVSDTVKKGVLSLREAEKLIENAEQFLLSELGLANWQPRHTLTFTGSYRAAVHARRLDAEHYQPKYKELRERIRNYPHGYCKITDIATHSQEMVSPRETPDQPFQYVELSDINKSIGVVEKANTILGKEAPSRARMVLRAGDVIASSVQGSLDKVALVPEHLDGSVGSTGFFVFRPRNVESGYLLALVKSVVVREQMACEAAGTILAAVPAKNLRNIIVPQVPSAKRQQIDDLIRQSHAARRQAQALLEKAKRAVEMAIEEGEEKAVAFLRSANILS